MEKVAENSDLKAALEIAKKVSENYPSFNIL